MSGQSGSSRLRDLFQSALQDYERVTNISLAKHPLAEQLNSCHSVESITTFLQDQARALGDHRGNDRLVESIKNTVSTLCMLSAATTPGDAVHLPFPFAKTIYTGLAILLIVAKREHTTFDDLVDLFESIERLLKPLEVYTQVPPTPTADDMIVRIMVELLSTLALTTKELKEGRSKKFMKKVRGEMDPQVVLQRLDRLSQNEARRTRSEILRVVYGLVKDMSGKASGDSVWEALELLHQMTSEMTKSKRDQLQKAIRGWLSPPDPWKNHHIIYESRHEATAAWFIQGETFSEWKSSDPSSLLWIHGKPGAGKSVFCSTIIEDIMALRKSGLASLGFFYHDFRDDQKKDRLGLISSLLVQLCHQSDSYCDILTEFYLEHGSGSQHPSDNSLLRCLTDVLKLPGQAPVYLVVDALDECPNNTAMPSPREKVLGLVEDLIDAQLPGLRICVTSRPEIDIKSSLEPLAFRTVSLHDERGQMEDIEDYIKSVVNKDPRNRRWNAKDKKLVIDALTKNADGMFRWVYCQLLYLRGCHPGRIRHALSELPETLDETYERTLREINKADWQLAHRLLQCVAVASRPLHVEELAEFLAFDYQSESIPKFQEDWRLENPVDAVLSTCSTLLALVNIDGSAVIQFSHFSVREFLTSIRLAESDDEALRRYSISMTSAHTLVAQACLGILLHLPEVVTRHHLTRYPLVGYAARHWFEHGRFENVSQHAEEGMKQLFDPKKPHLAIWVWIYDPRNPLSDSEPAERPSPPRGTPLHYAAICGLHEIVTFLAIEYSRDLHSQNFNAEWTPLHVASAHGHIEVARILVKHGADMTARDNDGKTPLHVASRNGHVEVASFLIDHGADVAARNNDGWTPLYWASIEGHVEVAHLLIEHRADPTARAYDGRTALHWASTYGRVEVARFLVQHGVHATIRDGDGRTPLHVASVYGFLKIACFLIEHGSDTTARGNDGRTPLHDATSFGYIEVARTLVEHGADATAQTDDGRSPLHVAAFYGNAEIARILIEHGADVTARTNDGWTPLHSASSCGDVQIARFLVEHGADVTVQDNHGFTPWDVASRKGHVEVARFLDELGANAVGQANDGTPPASAEEGNEQGTHTMVRVNGGWTPLHFAVGQGNLDIVRFLVEHGADATAGADNGWTPLHVASSRGHIEITRFLVRHGVDATARDNDGRTPLHEALSYGHMEVARFLYDHSTITDTTTLTTTAPPTQGTPTIYYLLALVLLAEIYLHFM